MRQAKRALVASVLCVAASTSVSAVPDDMFTQPLMVDSIRGLVMATPFFVGSNQTAGFLRLPDGSVIRTVWPAAMVVSRLANGGDGEPLWPRCEPAVYSLALVSPDGKERWAKSYIYYNKIQTRYEACDSSRVGFTVRSALSEVAAPGYYEIPYRNRVFLGDPTDRRNLVILSPDTGEVQMREPPTGLRAVDAHELRNLKVRLVDEIVRDMAPMLRANKKLYPEAVYTRELFKRLEKALFPIPPVSKP